MRGENFFLTSLTFSLLTLGDVAPTVERWFEEPRGAGSTPAVPA